MNRPGKPRRLLVAAGCTAGLAAALFLVSTAEPPLPASSASQAALPAAPPPALPSASPPDPAPGFLDQYSASQRFTLGAPQSIQIAPAGAAVLFLRSAPRSPVTDLYEFDPATGQERLLASAERLLGGGEEHLSAEERARRERSRTATRGITSYDLSQDGTRVLVPLSGRLFVVERRSGAVRELPSAGGFPLDPRLSPDASRVACVRDGDLHVMDVATGTDRRLTTGAGATLSHGLAEFVAQEEMGRREGYWWSPDGGTIAFEESDTSQVEVFHIADPMHPDRSAEASPYPRPGRNNAVVRLGLVSAAGGAVTWADWDRQTFPYLAAATWTQGGPLTLLVQNREQTEERLLAVAPGGATRTLLAESDAAWLDINHSVPRWLPDGSGFLWLSERTGEARLELRAADGTLRRLLTPPGLGLQTLAGLDPAAAGGGSLVVVASTDPTQPRLWRLPLDVGGGAGAGAAAAPVLLTPAPGVYGAVVARDGGAAVWSEALLSGERTWSVRRRDGSEAGRLRSVLEAAPFAPRLELTTLGPLGFHAALVRPRTFTAGHKYPVLVRVYAGPGVRLTEAAPRTYLLDQWMADHGFIVFSMDGRGTPGRGRDWERVIKGSLIEVQLADQVAGLQAAGAKYPEMDLSRVGIVGWSFGGYFSAMAAMRRPDVYRAAVAGAPVCDWHDYDTHYTERYLGLPQTNPTGYRDSSVLTYCPNLRVPLLVVHGTADDNVYFMHSLKLTDGLFRAGRPYDFLVLPGFTHMVPDAAVQRALQDRIMSFFVAHLAAAG
jgi:dipeptidyl-peptidase 4